MALLAGVAGAGAAASFVAPWLIAECDVCEAATSILLSGTVPGKCTINVVAAAQAVDLPISVPGAQRVMIGSAQQDCNGRRSYILTISSMNCTTSPAGGKVLNSESGDYLSYSGEFVNPPTGGSETNVTGLLASSCAGQIGREVTHGKITNETSQVYLNFTGSSDLSAGTYQDIVTISLNMQ